jgi:tetratricopeptide (TPR) repeat protein
MAWHEQALEQLKSLISRFGDKFRGIVSFKMDETGFSLSINRPEIQVLYYFGYCYQCLGRYEKAIPLWDAILVGGSKSGGSVMAWDTLGIAIGHSNPEQVKALLHVLFMKALAQSLHGDNDAAVQTYRQVYAYAKSARPHAELYDSVFADAVKLVQDGLQISEAEETDGTFSKASKVLDMLVKEDEPSVEPDAKAKGSK